MKEEEPGVLVPMPEMVVMDLVFGAGGMGFVLCWLSIFLAAFHGCSDIFSMKYKLCPWSMTF